MAALASTLALVVHTSPTPTVRTPATPTGIPSANISGFQLTAITDDEAFLASIVKYDHKAAEALVEHYNNAVRGNSTFIRTNGGYRAAAASSDILPFCVTYTRNPVRVKIFKDKTTCDTKGWDTLFVFTAHTKKDKHHAPYPMCVGKAGNSERSTLFSGKADCSTNEWETDFSFYESD
ncbi:hypothetical protein BG015_001244 [Linnemannia schmuckeri]|uniref:Uncharacterized protein n=1 Tax=Linnemannia schmuckeri TaxID=64567 RepID=A0A9P5S408_9FUNG|nr:hypothetical protein BG015_001244 [Linnemannia schmuckeri]